MIRRVDVPLGNLAYSIHIGASLLQSKALWQSLLGDRQAFVVTDDQVAAHWLPALLDGLADHPVAHYQMPAGEQNKTLQQFSAVIDQLIAHRQRRNGVVIALGGGVVGDLAGFAASCYQRGCDVIQVPTTLLAMVDSSVGGKTAVNHPSGKNMVGTFHQPKAVIADTNTLKTLPEREFSAGMAEVIKYALIRDATFLDWLEQQAPALLQHEPVVLSEAIARSCENKARIVMADPLEQGERALLNLGHTFGHALETELGYGQWLHGEAVAVGILMACRLAEALGRLPNQQLRFRVEKLLKQFSLPIRLPTDINRSRLVEHMKLDKKNQQASIRFVLPNVRQESELVEGVDIEILKRVLDES